MRALTIQQPFAQLVCLGAKKIETRSWNTKHRGKILIHAGKKLMDNWYNDYPTFHFYLKDQHISYGAFIGTADIVDTVKITDTLIDSLSENELVFGDYTIDRFGWKLSNATLFVEPIPCKGALSLFNPLKFLSTDGINKLIDYGFSFQK